MGYTHHWKKRAEYTDRKWTDLLAAVAKITTAPSCPELMAVLCNHKAIMFDGEPSCETFDFNRTADRFTFCKTGRYEYDLAVCAVLSAAKHHLGDAIYITSDGSPEEWVDAVKFTRKVLGYGDFPFTEKGLIHHFTAPYAKQYIADMERLRIELGITKVPEGSTI